MESITKETSHITLIKHLIKKKIQQNKEALKSLLDYDKGEKEIDTSRLENYAKH